MYKETGDWLFKAVLTSSERKSGEDGSFGYGFSAKHSCTVFYGGW